MQRILSKKRAGVRWAVPAIPALCIVLFLTGAACTPSASKGGGTAENAGQIPTATTETLTPEVTEETAPEVTVVSSDELLEAIRDNKGKVVVVKFWATWCVPCVEELPKVIAFYEKHKDSETVAFVSVSADLADSVDDTVIPFLKEKTVPFPVRVIDAAGPDEIVAGLGIEETGWEGTLPAAFVFDKEGRLSKFWLGSVPEGALQDAVDALL